MCIRDRLNAIVTAGEKYLTGRGYQAYAQTTDRITVDSDNRSPLPHKTVATRAGLGWIGKHCLLVTPQYGSAVRISSLLTDAPLTCDAPVTRSQCGACHACVRYCPAHALKNTLWRSGMPREDIVSVSACYKKQREIMRALTAQEPYPEKKIMATIITRHGSAPQGLGTKMLIYRDGRCVGTIGGGCMEARVIQIARLMAAGEGEQARICHVDMTGNEAEEEGMVCGGEVDVFLEIV